MGQRRWTPAFRTLKLTVLQAGVAALLLLSLLLMLLPPLLPLLPPLLPTFSWRRATDGWARRSGAGVTSVLLWTMMRSGSRLTQHLLAAQPCSFLTEEPLRDRVAEGLSASLGVLQDLLTCRISARPDSVTHWINGTHLNDVRVREACGEYPTLCWDGALLDAVCRASCLRLVRVVAQGLSLAMALLQDDGSNVHVVHLVRDPRGMISSRRDLQDGRFEKFYAGGNGTFFHEEEMDVAILCQRYRHDLAVAMLLARHNPGRYTLVRYEDLAYRPYVETRRLYSFLDLPYTALVDTMVGRHTLGVYPSEWEEHPYATNKNSRSVVFAWRRRLPFSEVDRIQQECGDVLHAYGYRHFSRRQYEQEQDSPLLALPQPWAASRHGRGGDGSGSE